MIVAGAVVKPSTLEMPANMSALDAVMMSGGFNMVQANTSQVLVMRDDGKQGRVAYVVDMSGALGASRRNRSCFNPRTSFSSRARRLSTSTSSWRNTSAI